MQQYINIVDKDDCAYLLKIYLENVFRIISNKYNWNGRWEYVQYWQMLHHFISGHQYKSYTSKPL